MKKRDQYKVQVWNDHSFPWKETFKGDEITIPGNGFVEMEFYEAYEFKGQFCVLNLKADETEDPRSQKKIRCVEAAYKAALETPTDEDEDSGQEVFMCNAKECKKFFTTEAALVKHSEKDHAEEMVVDQEAERVTKKRGRPAKPQATA